ncbi:MAG: F0F1 ATP synthase subunit epsilon [Desulfovibrionaceae bacterium]|nr:F0F1 ATP synthase subunit epsilon [Desulfovibrionaceae bacterium]MBF0513010.1 F0F1 ATP synthase subunit epsilon [Desulfovibrionaceae bacterium]
MADKEIKLEVVTPDKMVLSQTVEYVGCPGVAGEFGVLPNHIPFLSALGIGNLHYKKAGKTFYVFVAGGFAEVGPDRLTVLAEVAEKAEDIDIERARKAEDRARKRLEQQNDNVDFARARVALQRAITRMSAMNAAKSTGTA